MRLVLVTINYPPMCSSTAVQMRDLANGLVSLGHSPTVIVPDPSLKKSWTVEYHDSLCVLRLWSLEHRNIPHWQRLIAEVLLPWLMLFGLFRSPLFKEKWDGVVWWSPSIFFSPFIKFLKRRSGCPSYMILRDIFPAWALDLGILRPGLFYEFLSFISLQQHKAADIVGVQSPSNLLFAPRFSNGKSPHYEVLWNWIAPSRNRICSIKVANTSLAGRKIIVYAGNMGVAQNLDTFIQLAVHWRYREDVGFLLVGRGTHKSSLMTIAASHNLSNVLFFDEIDPSEVPGLLSQCHIGYLCLDIRHKTHNIPGKFLSYVQAGLPVLAIANRGSDLVELIKSSGVGCVVDREPLFDTLEEFAEDMLSDDSDLALMSEHGRKLAVDLFSINSAVNQIVSALSISR